MKYYRFVFFTFQIIKIRRQKDFSLLLVTHVAELYLHLKSGKIPYGRIKKYFRENSTLVSTGTSTNSSTSTDTKVENLQFYYHPDHLGSSSYITDASGEVYQHDEYFPFGETFVEERTDAEYTSYLFNGKELDQETGLYYYGARYYDPRISMWYGVDPKSDAAIELTPYRYGQNNPVKIYDPNGLDDFFDFNGNYIRSSKSGSQIRIMNNGSVDQLTDFNYSRQNIRNRDMLAKVATYYAHKAGVSKSRSVGVLDVDTQKDGQAFAAYMVKSDSYMITVDKNGNVNPRANNLYNMENAYVHEHVHEVDPTSRTAFGEIKAITKQSSVMSFFDTSSRFKEAAGSYAASSLNNALFNKEITPKQAQDAVRQLNGTYLGFSVKLKFTDGAVHFDLIKDEIIVKP
ncbi:RHS repeat-associated core domain-containing protein [Prolixibacter sp. NT017]|uniref:RHS repeat-associated core domain-containing protein n=1 Tax=Prolixibacter sp. NT017 TaxID=2652390 RepID=UPI00188FC488|nr:RHS repeat-associated core domain-containing protein [Prolixibacter sp. NT017]